MARRRKEKPVERLRSGWTSTDDLAETMAAMFQRPPTPVSPFSASAEVIVNNGDTSVLQGSTDTIANEPQAPVTSSTGATVSGKPKATVVVDRIDTVAFASRAMGSGGSSTMVAGKSEVPVSGKSVATVVVDESTDTVVIGPSDTVSPESPIAVAADLETSVFVDLTDTVLTGRAPGPTGSFWYTEGTEGLFPASRIRRIVLAQDVLTHSEQSVYDVLWGAQNQNGDDQRFASMGYETIGKSRPGHQDECQVDCRAPDSIKAS